VEGVRKENERANSAATIRGLRRLGVKRVLMLTGDHPERARTMAEALGLDDFHAGLLPQDQADVLQRLAAEGARIAFAGLPRDGRTSAAVVHGART
jgi:cation-transporting P-type ATPase C